MLAVGLLRSLYIIVLVEPPTTQVAHPTRSAAETSATMTFASIVNGIRSAGNPSR